MIKFIDLNKSLVSKVKRAVKNLPFEVEVLCEDIFKHAGVIVSASNPKFTMAGGLDALIKKNYSKECSRVRKGKNQRIGDVIFTITVGEDFKATRELVGEALKFALKNTRKSEDVLISGLGTGIGSLNEDDFVWLFLAALSEYHGYGWGIKFVKKDSHDFYTGKVEYKSGKWLEQLDAQKDGRECGVGLHLGKSFIGAGNYNMPERIYFCIYKKDDFCGEGIDKVRVKRLLPIIVLPQWLGYGKNGNKIIKKIGKKINPEKYNPYQATKLPAKEKIKKFMAQVGAQVGAQVWDQVGAQVWAQVWAQVRAQVGDQVGAQVWAQVGAQVGDQVGAQVRAQVGDQVGAQVRAQVWAQVWATSYWAINIHFELGISHWFGEFLKLGIMPIFLNGKIKIFGKKGKYLGEYDKKEIV